MRARERWLKYKKSACDREEQVGEVAQTVWPLILKAARASCREGCIVFVRGGDPVAGLLKHLGGRPKKEGRYFALALSELSAAGLLSVQTDAIVVSDWAQYKPSPEKKTPEFFWLKLWASESGSFRDMPPMCRGFAHLLLRVADEDGFLPATTTQVLDRLGWQSYYRDVPNQAGGKATRVRRYLCERRHIDGWMQLLFEDGYLERDPVDPTQARIRNYTRLQPPAPRFEHAEPTQDPRRTHAGLTQDSRRTHAEQLLKDAESFTSHVDDPIRSDEISDQTPLTPRGGGSELGGGSLRDEQSQPPEPIPEPVDDGMPKRPSTVHLLLPPGRPDWYREIWAAYPRREAELAAWEAAKAAARRAGSGEQLRDKVLECLSWQKSLTRWRKANETGERGAYIPSLVNYLARDHWRDEMPGTASAFIAPPETDAERAARLEAERKAERERKRQERIAEASKPKPDDAARIRPFWENMPETRTYREPENPEDRAVVAEVLSERLAAFRAENASAPLPRLFAGFEAARGSPAVPAGNEASNGSTRNPRDLPAVALSEPEASQPDTPENHDQPNDLEAMQARRDAESWLAPLGQWNPKIPTTTAGQLALLRMAAKRCEVVDARLRALER